MSQSFAPFINALRSGVGLTLVALEDRLERAAQSHAEDLAAREVLSHGSGPDNTDTAAERIVRLGYQWSWVAENTAFGQRDRAEVMAAWAGSAGHREAMLSPQAREFGFGGATNRLGPYWVLVLAAPA